MEEFTGVTVKSGGTLTDDVTAVLLDVDFFGEQLVFEGSAKRHPVDVPDRGVGVVLAYARAFRAFSRFLQREADQAIRGAEFVREVENQKAAAVIDNMFGKWLLTMLESAIFDDQPSEVQGLSSIVEWTPDVVSVERQVDGTEWTEGGSDGLDALNRDTLRLLASTNKIPGRGRMLRSELESALRAKGVRADGSVS